MGCSEFAEDRELLRERLHPRWAEGITSQKKGSSPLLHEQSDFWVPHSVGRVDMFLVLSDDSYFVQ